MLRVADTSERFDACLYGLSLLLYTMISSTGLMAIGMVMHHTIGALLMMVTYYLNQSFGGGFHAKTHFRCFLTMSAGIVFGSYLMDTHFSRGALLMMVTVSYTVLVIHPLQLHKHKAYLSANRSRLSILSVVISTCLFLAAVLCIFFAISEPEIVYGLVFGMIASAVSRMAAIIMAVRTHE